MKVQLADQSNIHVWDVEIEGPEQSVYAVCIHFSTLHFLFLREFIQCQRLTERSVFRFGPHMQSGTFKLLMTLPKDYPFKPPVLNFQTKIYHPNVSNDDRGSMCLGIVRPDEWKPPNRIVAVLAMTRSLLIEPNPDDAVEAAVAEQYKRDREGFEKTARDWVKRYASAKG